MVGRSVVVVALCAGCQGGSVADPLVVALAVDPSEVVVDLGGAAQLTAIATYDDDTTADVTDAAAWSVADPEVATVEAGLVGALAKGATTVVAAHDGFEVEVAVDVNDPGPYAVTITGDWSLQHGGQGQQIFARVVDDADGSVVACGSVVSESAEWTMTAEAVLLAGHVYHGEAFADANQNQQADDTGHSYVGDSGKAVKRAQDLVVGHIGLSPDWFGQPCDPATPALTGE